MASGTSKILELIAPLETRLDKLRRQIASWLLLDGGARFVWTVLIVAGLDFVLDFVLHLDKMQRGAILVLVLGFLVVRAWKLLVWIPSQKTRSEALCFEIQKRHPNLGDGLVTAYELAHHEGRLQATEVSLPLVQQAVRLGMAALESVSLDSLLNAARMRTNWLRLLVGLAAVMALQVAIFVKPQPMATIWFERNVLLREVAWPQDVYLHLEGSKDGRIKAYRGEEWQAVVTAEAKPGKMPSSVTLEFRGGAARPAQVMKQASEGRFELTVATLRQSGQVRARASGIVSPWLELELIDPPAVDVLELFVKLPAYAGAEEVALPAGQGPYPILEGSSLKIRGRFNKSVAVAEVSQGEWRKALSVQAEGGLEFSGEIGSADLKTGSYLLSLGDLEGHVSKQGVTFGVRLVPDAEPKVKVKLLGVGGMITKRAMIPWELRATDDYGLAEISGRYRTVKPDGEKGAADAGAVAKVDGDPFAIALGDLKLPRTQVVLPQTLDVEKLVVSEGSNLSLWVVATDNDNIGPANVGRSADMSLKVVTEEEFRQSILEREKELRLELERQLRASEELLTDIKALRVSQKGDGTGDNEALVNLARRQKGIATVLQSISSRLKNIVGEIAINRIEGDEAKLQTRLKDEIIAPLDVLITERLAKIVAGLDQVRRESKSASTLSTGLVPLEMEEGLACEDLRKILAAMSESEDFQKAVNMLYEIQRAQQDVLRRTQQEKERRIREALEPKK